MTPFLDKIADRLLDKFPHGMEDIAIVFPSKRAVVFFKYYLSKKIENPVFLPDFYSIEEFIENLSGLRVLDNMSLQFRLYETYLKYPPKNKETFSDFLKWSNILLHDFNDIDKSLVDAESIYSNLNQVKELENWSVEDWSFLNQDLTLMQNDYLSFFQQMLKWYNGFRDSLLEEKLAYQGLAYKQAVENITHLNIKWKKIWFVGLNALTKSEQEILDFLKKEDVARVFWDADQFYYDNPLHEAGIFLRKQSTKWSEIDFKGVGDYYKQKKDVFNVVACPKNISQAKVASQVVKSFSKCDLEDSNTAIVLADEKLLYPVLHNLPTEVKELNITMGSPLKSTPMFSFVKEIFNMQISAQRYNRNVFYYKDVIALIEHPYFLKFSNTKEIQNFKSLITKQNIVFITQDNIKNIFVNDFTSDLFTTWKGHNDAIKILNKLIEYFKIHLVRNSATVESEVLTTFFRTIIILQKLLDKYNFVLELKTLKVIMEQLVSKEIIPFQGEPLRGVQLMGILETRTLDFKNVIMLSVNEGKLPKGKTFTSFIPYDMKKYFQLPTYTDSDAVFSYHFYRLLQRASNVTLIYNSETDDFGSGERSRFITQLISEYNGEIQEYIYKNTNLNSQNVEPIVIDKKRVQSKIKSWALKGVSPSALNIYNNCRLHFYYHYLADIRIDSQVDEYVDASSIGTIIHHVLDVNYPLGLLTEKYISNTTDAILMDVKNNFIDMLSEESIKGGKNYLSLCIAQQLTKNFLNLEKKILLDTHANNEKIRIIAKEADLSFNLVVDGVNFRLIGKVDRVDLKGDELRIIDYKTGYVDQSELLFTDFDELIDNPSKSKAFQLLMYAYLYLKNYPDYMHLDIVAGNFSFKNLKPGLLKLGTRLNKKESQTLNINENILNQFEIRLKTLLSRINTDSFSVAPHLKNCEWCSYKSTFKL